MLFLSRHIVPCTSKHCASLHFWQTAWPDAIGSPILRSDADRPGQGGSKGCPIPSPSGRSPFYNMSCRPRLPHCRCNTVRGVLKRCSGSRISGTGRLRPHIPSVRMPRCPLHRGSRPAGKVSPVRKQENQPQRHNRYDGGFYLLYRDRIHAGEGYPIIRMLCAALHIRRQSFRPSCSPPAGIRTTNRASYSCFRSAPSP